MTLWVLMKVISGDVRLNVFNTIGNTNVTDAQMC
jgi:hypothetical protein